MANLRSFAGFLRGRSGDGDQWKRNQFALAFSVFVWFCGTSFVVPFLAIFVQQLGEFSPEETALWAGVTLTIASFTSAVAGPFWGALADRFGRKLMLQCSLVLFSANMALMGLVVTPWQLVLVRSTQGLFGGFVVVALTMVSVSNPSDRVGEGIGAIQAGRVLGMATGPFIGGFAADTFGIRSSFFFSFAIALVAWVVVRLFVTDTVAAPAALSRQAPKVSFWTMLVAPAFLAVAAAIVAVRLVEHSFEPILPVFVATLGVSSIGLATTTGFIVSGGLVATSAAAIIAGRLTRGRSAWPFVPVVLLAGAVAMLPMAFAQSWGQLLVFRVIVGVALGAGATLTFAAATEYIPEARRGLGMGLLATAASYGSAMGGIVASGVGVFSLRMVFVADAILFALTLGIYALALRRAGRRLDFGVDPAGPPSGAAG